MREASTSPPEQSLRHSFNHPLHLTTCLYFSAEEDSWMKTKASCWQGIWSGHRRMSRKTEVKKSPEKKLPMSNNCMEAIAFFGREDPVWLGSLLHASRSPLVNPRRCLSWVIHSFPSPWKLGVSRPSQGHQLPQASTRDCVFARLSQKLNPTALRIPPLSCCGMMGTLLKSSWTSPGSYGIREYLKRLYWVIMRIN